MEKQEAIEFILRELNNNRSQEEIISMLSEKLSAPSDIVGKFVSQVVDQATPHTPQSQGFLQQQMRENGELEEEPFNLEQITSIESEKTQSFSTPWEMEPDELPSQEELSSIDKPPPFYPSTVAGLQEETLSPQEFTSPEPSTSEAITENMEVPTSQGISVENLALTAKPSQDISQAQLEKMILNALSKNRRQSDIVAAVCERMDMSWDEAQSLVAKVASENRKQLASRQNCIFIPLAILAILAGLTLLYASLGEVIPVVLGLVEPGAEITENLQGIQQSYYDLPWAVTGFVLFFGGIVGLFMSLRG